jgi:23S rRNA (cytosine1962-C5)-methyltransferase
MEWLDYMPLDTYDIIICDPPTFSNSKRMEDIFDVQRDHVLLLKKLLKGCTDTGKIYFSNNCRASLNFLHKCCIRCLKGKTSNQRI